MRRLGSSDVSPANDECEASERCSGFQHGPARREQHPLERPDTARFVVPRGQFARRSDTAVSEPVRGEADPPRAEPIVEASALAATSASFCARTASAACSAS